MGLLDGSFIELKPMTTEYAKELFTDFENDPAMFTKDSYKPFEYDPDMIARYIDKYKNKGYILLGISYNNNIIGEIRFKSENEGKREIGIVIKNDTYKNMGIGTVAISLAIDYAKNIGLKRITARVLKTNKRSQRVIEKNGFILYREDDLHYHYLKNL